MINENENLKRIKEKINFFMNEKVQVHVKKKDLKFLNGYFIEQKEDNVFSFKDRVLGMVHLFVSDIFEVNEYTELRK